MDNFLLVILQFLIDYKLYGWAFGLGTIIIVFALLIKIIRRVLIDIRTWIALVLTGLLFVGLSVAVYYLDQVASPQANLLQQRYQEVGYELGWRGGEANSGDENSVYWTKVTSVTVIGKRVEITYEWMNGRLSGTFEGNTLKGTWIQDNGRGQFELTFSPDFSSAFGWGNDGPGTPYLEHYIR
jgi:hypothetical protein